MKATKKSAIGYIDRKESPFHAGIREGAGRKGNWVQVLSTKRLTRCY